MSTTADGTVLGTRSPFVGTRPFAADEALFFFGRERDAARLSNLIIANTLTVLYGESGVGKSSLINARLPLALEEIDSDWLIIPFFEWQLGCEARLQETVEKKIEAPVTAGLAKALLSFAAKENRPVLLVLDQFEEYFLYHPQGINVLDAELAKVINRRVSPVRVLLSLRSDGLFLLDRLRLRIPNVFGSMIAIEPLDARAAIECAVRPVEAYNSLLGTRAVQVPAQESDLVKALVSGADEEQILLRLPGRGRSELEQGERGSPRIVAPFLQMALDALWQEDVVNSGRDHLELATLRRLAGLEENKPSSQAVGAIAERYVDAILHGFSVEEKAVCAVILERMVLPSGQKVAVKIMDLNPVLTEAQRRMAASVLSRLSCNQERRLIKMVVGQRDSEPHYQIVHDAMAIPLLSWVEQWKSDQRAARARREAEEWSAREHAAEEERKTHEKARARRRVISIGVGLILVAGAISAYLGNMNAYSKVRVDRLTSLVARDPRPGFRLPLLLSVAGLAEAARWPEFILDRSPIRRVLREKLLLSPREGGEFSAIGFDAHGIRIVWIDETPRMLVICNLRALPDPEYCATAVESYKNRQGNRDVGYTLPLPPLEKTSSNIRLQSSFLSVGFVEGLEHPVVYSKGILHSWQDNKWRSDDVATLLPNLSQAGSVFAEVVSGGLKITVNDWPNSRMWATRLPPVLKSNPPFETAPPEEKWLRVIWRSGSPSPVVSPDGTLAASISSYRNQAEEQQANGQQAEGQQNGEQQTGQQKIVQLQTILNLTRASDSDQRNPSDEEIDLSADIEKNWAPSNTRVTAEPGSSLLIRPGLGFTADSRSLAVLYRRVKDFTLEIKLLDLSKGSSPEQTRFGVDPNLPRSGPPAGGQFSFPPLAAIKVRSVSDKPPAWRFAWMTQNGIRLLEGDAGGYLFQRSMLLPGLDGASKLEFSGDGEFLVLQNINFQTRKVSVRVWDLRTSRKNLIERLDDAELRKSACRVAAIEPNPSSDERYGNQFSEHESQEWQVPSQSCPTIVAR